ncbi:Protein CapI, partial [Stylophora pistillata]
MCRDFTYIDDIVAGTIAALDRSPEGDAEMPPYKIYNLGNCRSEKLMDFIRILECSLGKKAKMELLPLQPGDIPETYANIEDARKELGFEPKTSIE